MEKARTKVRFVKPRSDIYNKKMLDELKKIDITKLEAGLIKFKQSEEYKEFVEEFKKKIGSPALFDVFKKIVFWLIKQVQSIFTLILTDLVKTFKWIGETMANWIHKVIFAYETYFIKFASYYRDLEPERVFDSIRSWFLWGFILLSFLYLVCLLLDFIPTINEKTTKEIVKFIKYKIVYNDYFIGLITTDVVRFAIGYKLGYYYKSIFRPYLPEFHGAVKLYTLGYLNDEELKKIYAYQMGLPDKYYEGIKLLTFKNLTTMDLIFGAKSMEYDPAYFERELKREGYDPKGIQWYLEYIAKEQNREERESIVSKIRDMYEKGMLTFDEFSKSLDALGFPEARNKSWKELAKWERLAKKMDYILDIYTYLYRKEVIDEQEFEKKLIENGFDPEIVNLIVALEMARKGKRHEAF